MTIGKSSELSEAQTVQLPEKLDGAAAGELAKTLLAMRGGSVVIDASAVTQLGAQSAQVLAAAVSTWASDEASIRIANASPEFNEASTWLGLNGLFATEEQQ